MQARTSKEKKEKSKQLCFVASSAEFFSKFIKRLSSAFIPDLDASVFK